MDTNVPQWAVIACAVLALTAGPTGATTGPAAVASCSTSPYEVTWPHGRTWTSAPVDGRAGREPGS
ncbi:hypothetical protein ACFY19_04015 [Streptosporangium saharense]|uniref:hypothetical protein n=1 Tax=Streptosporangium saharense TaxID=1706840 RepID=UPI0036C8C4E4